MPVVVDVFLAIGIALDTAVGLRGKIPAAGILVMLVATLALVLRRRAPIVVLGTTAAGVLVCTLLTDQPLPLILAPLIALYTVSTRYQFTISAGAAAILAAGIVAATIPQETVEPDDFLDSLPFVLVAWIVGYGARVNRIRLDLAEGRTARIARERDAATRTAVATEQARIARELHDIVAHHVTVMVTQAAARRRTADHPVLASIESTGREALTELRRLLDVLRTDNPTPDHGPAPGLDQLAGLAERIGQAGLPVSIIVAGERRELPASVESNAYRIVQEALTNTLKHARATHAVVQLDYRPDALEVLVRDDGCGPTPWPLAGHGLIGMTARTALLGGELTAGPAAERGFQVAATLPCGGRHDHQTGCIPVPG
jgi:signal transduction histidine kinase